MSSSITIIIRNARFHVYTRVESLFYKSMMATKNQPTKSRAPRPLISNLRGSINMYLNNKSLFRAPIYIYKQNILIW